MLADPFPPNGGALVSSVSADNSAETYAAAAAVLTHGPKGPAGGENLQLASVLPINSPYIITVDCI